MPCCRIIAAWGALMVALGVPLAAGATTMRLASPQELSTLAQVVVVAEVAETTAFWRGTRIISEHRVTVHERWKGSVVPGQILRVETLGGVVGLIGQQVAGAPRLAVGQRIVLYLVAGEDDAWRSVGMWQGVFHIDDSNGAPAVYRQPGDSRVVGTTSDPFPTALEDLRGTTAEVADEP